MQSRVGLARRPADAANLQDLSTGIVPPRPSSRSGVRFSTGVSGSLVSDQMHVAVSRRLGAHARKGVATKARSPPKHRLYRLTQLLSAARSFARSAASRLELAVLQSGPRPRPRRLTLLLVQQRNALVVEEALHQLGEVAEAGIP